MDKNRFESWLSEMKRLVADGSLKSYLPKALAFLNREADIVFKDGILYLNTSVDFKEYKDLIDAIGENTNCVCRLLDIVCYGVFNGDCIGIWENFLLYTVSPKERELCLFLIEGFYRLSVSRSEYNLFKYSFIGLE